MQSVLDEGSNFTEVVYGFDEDEMVGFGEVVVVVVVRVNDLFCAI